MSHEQTQRQAIETEGRNRALLLVAQVEIALAAGDATHASESARELREIADQLALPDLAAHAAQAAGAVRLAWGDAPSALELLRRAAEGWRELGATHELARAQELLTRAEAQAPAGGDKASSVLSPREIEVLSELATGRTNKGIAEALNISEKAVARHVADIFTKLNLPNRAAATAWAYENGLIMRTQI